MFQVDHGKTSFVYYENRPTRYTGKAETSNGLQTNCPTTWATGHGWLPRKLSMKPKQLVQ